MINRYCRGTCCWQVLYGVTQMPARWKTCVDNMARSFMPTAVGQLYAKAYFTASAKAKVGNTTSLLTSYHFTSHDGQRYVTTYITASAEAKVSSNASLLTSHHFTSHDGQRYLTKYITATAKAKVGSTTSLVTSHHFTSHPPLLASTTSPSTSPPLPSQR